MAVNKQKVHINVLDHGFVKLVDYMGNDHDIVCAARVMEEDWRGAADIKLIHYLMEHKHTSPFEHAVMKFHIKAPIFVIRQWHRHRTWSYNEVSARYRQLPNEFYIPKPQHIGKQSPKNHQGRDICEGNEEVQGSDTFAVDMIDMHSRQAYLHYETLLDSGVPREVARGVLPVNIYTEMYATVDVHNLMHFLRLRLDSHAQYEIRVYAEAMLKCMADILPVTTNAFIEMLNQ